MEPNQRAGQQRSGVSTSPVLEVLMPPQTLPREHASTGSAAAPDASSSAPDSEGANDARLRGISLPALLNIEKRVKTLVAQGQFPDVSDYQSLTTGTLVHGWVSHSSTTGTARLADCPELVDPSQVGTPQYFVSHAWSGRFCKLVEAVRAHLANAGDDTRVWIDVFAVNQHGDTCPEMNRADVQSFEATVQLSTMGTLVVVDMERCNPATRGWCLYEWDHTVTKHGVEGLIFLGLSHHDRQQIVSAVDIAQAECFKRDDLDMILGNIKENHGSLERFNSTLKLVLMLSPLSYREDLRQLTKRSRGTTWNFHQVDQWLGQGIASGPPSSSSQSTAARLVSVVGEAGTGKSTVSAALIYHAHAQCVKESTAWANTVLAYHFVKFNDQRRLNAAQILKSLVFQVASRVPSLQAALFELDAAKLAKLRSVDEACDLLVPCLERGCAQVQNVVLLLDALDEGDPLEQQRADFDPLAGKGRIVPVGNKPLQLLVGFLAKRLPPKFRFVVSTRPDAMLGRVRDVLGKAFGSVLELRPSAVKVVDQPLPGGGADGEQTIAEDEGVAARLDSTQRVTDSSTGGTADGNPSSLPASSLDTEALLGANGKEANARTGCEECVADAVEELARLGIRAPHDANGGEQETEVPSAGGHGEDAITAETMDNETPTAAQVDGQADAQPALDLEPKVEPSAPPQAEGNLVYFTVMRGIARLQQQNKRLLTAGPTASAPTDGEHDGGDFSSPPILPRDRRASPTLQDLYDLYAWLFRMVPPASKAAVDLLHVVLAAQEPAPVSMLERMGIYGACQELPAWGLLFYTSEHRVYLLHKSLSDWLRSEMMSSDGKMDHADDGATRADQCVASWRRGTHHGDLVLSQYLVAMYRSNAASVLPDAACNGSKEEQPMGAPSTLDLHPASHTYAVKYLFHHCASIDGRTHGAVRNMLLDAMLRDWDYLHAAFEAGTAGHIVRGLGTLERMEGVNTATDGERGSMLESTATRTRSSSGDNHAVTNPSGAGKVTCTGDGTDDQARMPTAGGEQAREAMPTVSISPGADDGPTETSHPGGEELLRDESDSSRSGTTPGLALSSGGAEKAATVEKDSRRGEDTAGQTNPTTKTGATSAGLSPYSHEALRWLQCCFSDFMSNPSAMERITLRDTPILMRKYKEAVRRLDAMTRASKRPAACATRKVLGGRPQDAWYAYRAVFKGHSDSVDSVAFSPDGGTLATGSKDKTARLWDVASGECVATLEGHSDWVFSVAFSPDGGTLATGSNDKTARLWDVASGECVATLEGHSDRVTSVAFSPDGGTLATGSHDKTARLWDVASGECVATLEARGELVLGQQRGVQSR